MAEMKALEYLREKNRMTESKNGKCGIFCRDCPLSSTNNGTEKLCSVLETNYLEKTVAIVQKWAEEHPRKTMLQDFLEKYPNEPLGCGDNLPTICPCDLSYESEWDCEGTQCFDCWNRPLEE